MEKSLFYQIFNDLLDSCHHQDEEKRHEGGPATSGRHIRDLLRKTQRCDGQSEALPNEKDKKEFLSSSNMRENTVHERLCQDNDTIDVQHNTFTWLLLFLFCSCFHYINVI